MATKSTHARFWALLKQMPGYNDEYREDIKVGWVDRFSKNRTVSLSELSEKYPQAYAAMIQELERKVNESTVSALKAVRSDALKQIQRAGVDTSVWAEVDRFLINYHVSDKKFYYMTICELQGAMKQLFALADKYQNRQRELKKAKQVAELKQRVSEPVNLALLKGCGIDINVSHVRGDC